MGEFLIIICTEFNYAPNGGICKKSSHQKCYVILNVKKYSFLTKST